MKKTGLLHILSAVVSVIIIFTGCESSKSTGPEVSGYADVSILVNDEYGRPVVNVQVTSFPFTTTALTDLSGRVVFENIQIREYTFYLRRSGFPTYTINITPDPNKTDDVVFVVINEIPVAYILFPENGKLMSVRNIRLKGNGIDPENGVLPDSSLIWHSNIDGEIGRGTELFVESLTLGNHIITLEVFDLNKKKDSASINLKIIDYNPDSYFPLPDGALWVYSHLLKKFTIVNTAGYPENWELDNISVETDGDNIRTSIMTYNVEVIKRTKVYYYTVTDYFENDGDDLYVLKTTENIRIWNGNPYGDPSDKLDIVTTYDPKYLLLEKVSDIQQNSTFQSNVITSVEWTFIDRFREGVQNFTESFKVETTVVCGAEETLITQWGEYDVIPVTISHQGAVRKWWLARGLGIIRLEYNSFSTIPVADMMVTNLTDIIDNSAKSAKFVLGNIPHDSILLNTAPLPHEDSPERLKEVRNILKSLAPR